MQSIMSVKEMTLTRLDVLSSSHCTRPLDRLSMDQDFISPEREKRIIIETDGMIENNPSEMIGGVNR